MNIAYYTGYRNWWQNRMFDRNSDCNSNNVLDRFIALKKYLEEKNINFNTFDIYKNLNDIDIWLIQEPTQATVKFVIDNNIDPSKVIFYLHEPYVFNKWGWDYIKNFHFFFKAILTWESEYPRKDKKFFHYHFPVSIDLSMYDYYLNNKKENLALIMHSNKVSEEKGELYSFRRTVIRYFENRGDSLLDLFGHGWNDNSNPYPFFTNLYKGTTVDKFTTYSKYYYSFCIDNCIVPGYITYDPIVSMAAGTVPIYVPMPDSKDFIPDNSFIDISKFNSLDELLIYMTSIIKTGEYEEIRKKGKEFLSSEKFFTFTNQKYCEDIYKAIEYLENYLKSGEFQPSVYLNKDKVAQSLNPHFAELFNTDNGAVLKRVEPLTLINEKRIDVIAKYIYVKYKEHGINSKWALELYNEHIRVLNNFNENDGSGKTGQKAFLSSFNKTIDSIRTEGFDEQISVIPISYENGLIEGAHRLAAGLYLGKTVSTLMFSHEGWYYDYQYFRKKGLPEEILDNIALEYCRLIKDLKTVLLFPSAIGKTELVMNILQESGEIYYYKEIKLKNEGSRYLMMQIYKGEKWLGSWQNQFSGAKSKANYCFKSEEPLRLFIFRPITGINVFDLKEKIRKIYNIEKHSVHINDTYDETINIASALLNKNSIHFLNNVKLNSFIKFQSLFDSFEKVADQRNITIEDICLTGSSVLALYGLRDANDLDYVKSEKSSLIKITDEIKCHDSEAKYYPTNFDNIIFNPRNHFYFNGIKFATLDIVKQLKEKRTEYKDIKDIELINSVTNHLQLNLVDNAQYLLESCKFRDALEILIPYIKQYPYDIKALNITADCFVQLEEHKTAAIISYQILKLNPSNQNALRILTGMQQRDSKDESSQANVPQFSIIMANYNGDKYIEAAVKSVLSQTFSNWELIIVDDYSTDDSLNKIEKYLSDKRISLIRHNTNKKYIGALKTGIANVKSNFFGTLDSDDALFPEAVETMLNAHLENKDAGFIYSQFIYCDENLIPKKIGYCSSIPEGKSNLDTDAVSHFRTFKLDYYLKSAHFDETILHSEDKDISYKMEEVGKLKFINKPLYLYRELPGSISHTRENRELSLKTMLQAKLNAISRRKEKCRIENLYALNNYKNAVRSLYENDFSNAVNFINEFNINFKYCSLPKYDNCKTMFPALSIVIVAYKIGFKLLECIDSILNNKNNNYEIIIVDNGGNDEILSNLIEKPLHYISLPENINPAEGRNIGAHFARAQIISFLDDDAVVEENYVESVLDAFHFHKIYAIRGKVLPKNPTLKIPEIYDLGSKIFHSDITIEGNSAIIKNIYHELNGMDPLLFGGEGLQLSYRLAEKYGADKILYIPQIVIYHDPSDEVKEREKQKRYDVMLRYLVSKYPDVWVYHKTMMNNRFMNVQSEVLLNNSKNSPDGHYYLNVLQKIKEEISNRNYKQADTLFKTCLLIFLTRVFY